MRLDQIDRLPINESYARRLRKAAGNGGYLVSVFREFNKLTGIPTVDVHNILTMQRYAESSLLTERDIEVPPPTMPGQAPQEPQHDPWSHIGQHRPADMPALEEMPIDEKKDCVLSLQDEIDKLQHLNIVNIGLPAGYTCPFADKCRTMASRSGEPFPLQKGQRKRMQIRQPNLPQEFQPGFSPPKGKVYDPEGGQDLDASRCFAASDEARKPDLRRMRWRNFDLLRLFKGDKAGTVDLMLRSLDWYERSKKKIKLFRIHDSGDFFSQDYFDAWLEVAKRRNDILFYAYTTSIPYWVQRKAEVEAQPNFRLVASGDSKHDTLADKHDLRKAIVVLDQGEAIRRKLNIDVDEFLAIFSDEDFALLVHNTGPAGSLAAKASKSIKPSKKYPEGRKGNEEIIKQMAAANHMPAHVLDELVRKYTTKAIQISDNS